MDFFANERDSVDHASMGISRLSICCGALVLASCATTGPAPPTLAPGLAGAAACQPGAIRVTTLEGISETHGTLSTWVLSLIHI